MSQIDPTQTQVRLPNAIHWVAQEGFPERSLDNAVLAGSLDREGLYYSLVRWHPAYMSAPHYYATDRLCIVVSGTWWVNSGNDFDPDSCVPTPAGSFVRRVAGTPHYDGVIARGAEPAVIAICGMAPIELHLVDPRQPFWRRV